MEVIIRSDTDQAVRLTAKLMEHRIRADPALVLGLATGRTMESVYAHLADCNARMDEIVTFNLDEYIGLRADDPGSYRQYMQKHLFSRTDISPCNIHVPDGDSENLKKEAIAYEDAIRKCGGIDLQLLGIGTAGHIGFNEPLSALMSRTRDKSLTETTRQQNAEMFGGDTDRVPKRALTMGVGTILEAREIILLATGLNKASIVAKAVEGSVTSMVTASALQLHPNCKVILDEDAAAELTGRDYYDFVFQNEPEWSDYQ